MKTPLPLAHCRFPIGDPPALATGRVAQAPHELEALAPIQVSSLPTRNEWGESWREGNLRKTRLLSPALSSFLSQEEREECSAIGHFSTCVDTNEPALAARAFTLVEILVSISLLSFIVIGLFAMFNQTQRAFRLGMTQADLLEAGRAVTEMIPRELEQTAPSHLNAVNCAMVAANSAPLLQSLPPGTTLMRTNLLQDCFILQRQNQSWVGIGYCVRTNDSTNGLWLPEVSPGHLGAGTLYRFSASTNTIRLNGLSSDPSQLYVAFLNACAPGSAAISNRICDGVVHFRLRAFATNGFPLFGDSVNLANTNACFRTNSLTSGYSLVRQTQALPNLAYPDNWWSLKFASNAVPAAVEMELGLLEQYAWERYNSIGNAAARLTYLQRPDISSSVHLFRQRIPIRNVDPSAYQ